ncbi:exonuclease SbcCD subunit D C-terminal domain-containing protein, partial [Patulibacter sp. S7RM1-6]
GGLFAALAEEEPAPPAAVAPATGPRAVVRYAGSPLPYSFTEADAPKSTAIVDLGADGVEDVRLVPVPAPFRLVRLRGELEALLDDPALAVHEAEDAWLEVTLTDARLPARPMERLRRRFPRVLVLQHAPDGELAPATVAAARVRGRSDLEVLERFVADVRGAGPTEDERPLLRDAVERVARRSEED